MVEYNAKYPAVLYSSFAVFGIFGNLNIIAATVRRRSLRTTCNQLIAIAAFFDLIHVSSHPVMTYFVFSGNYPTLESCFYIQQIPMIGCNAGEILMFLTSLDRLYCVAKPVAYQRLSAAVELTVCLIVALLFSGWLNYEAYLSLQPIKEKLTLCSVAASFTGSALDAMLRSIAAVTCCVVGGWLLSFSSFAVGVASGMKITDELVLYLGLPLNLSVSLNYPIYFAMSSQYRLAFKQQLNILSRNRVCKDSSPTSTFSKVVSTTAIKTRTTQVASRQAVV
uniref:G_PROTEIN_RECEP_F1_2 domain-containing protein n=1 Tax=Bursaphelenchus xylophilus TaxID=6326 RepID=A0A1I7SUU3_BURXY